jgi:hypothetical protein
MAEELDKMAVGQVDTMVVEEVGPVVAEEDIMAVEEEKVQVAAGHVLDPVEVDLVLAGEDGVVGVAAQEAAEQLLAATEEGEEETLPMVEAVEEEQQVEAAVVVQLQGQGQVLVVLTPAAQHLRPIAPSLATAGLKLATPMAEMALQLIRTLGSVGPMRSALTGLPTAPSLDSAGRLQSLVQAAQLSRPENKIDRFSHNSNDTQTYFTYTALCY